MVGASVYIAVCSARNRIRVRLKRLREPRYLIGAVVGVAYFYFIIFARGRRTGFGAGRGRGGRAPEIPAAFQMTGTSVAGLFAMLYAAVPWLLASRPKLLEFSEAEKALLFPAPVSRRQLLVHRIVRSQIGSLIASLFIALFATPFSGLARLRLAVGFWVLLVAVNIYLAAVALTRARLQSPVAAVRRVAWVPIGLLVAAIGVVGTSVVRQLLQPIASASDIFVHLARATSTGLPQIALWPFIAILRPPFSGSTAAFLPALGSALLVLAALTAWMLLSDTTFDALAGEGAPGRAPAAKQAVARARARNVGWTLPLAGRPETALLWKGAMQTLRGGNGSAWRYVPPTIGALIGVLGGASALMGARKMQGAAAFICILGAMISAMAIILGPLMARGDLRTDFEHLDLLKTWPMRAADVIRGEIVWPALLVSGIAWGGMLTAALFSSTALAGVSFVSRWSFALAAAFAGPALVAAQFAVHSAATIFFPAWVQLGRQRSRGLDMMGQRLIMLAAIVLSLLLFAVPGAMGGGVVWLIFHRLVGDIVFVPAAVVFAAIVLIEVLAVTELLGPAYERIDLSSVERGE
jgi:putative ABC exporter